MQTDIVLYKQEEESVLSVFPRCVCVCVYRQPGPAGLMQAEQTNAKWHLCV